jgi:hypothetical protein
VLQASVENQFFAEGKIPNLPKAKKAPGIN